MNDEQLKELKEFQERYKKISQTIKFAEKVTDALIEKSLRVDPSEDLLYHYTNIEALASGLLVKKPIEGEEISLWATDSKYLNDQTEIKLGSQMVQKLYEEKYNEKLDVEGTFSITRHYTISFSQDGDSIPMWSTYGKKGNGIALGFDRTKLKETLEDIYPCLYKEQDVELVIKEFHDKVLKASDGKDIFEKEYLSMCHASLALVLPRIIKHNAYEYEKEYRYVYSNLFPTDDVRFRYANNLIIPYIIKYLPMDALKRIIIGPNLNQERTEESIQWYLWSLGFFDVEIKLSEVPFRD